MGDKMINFYEHKDVKKRLTKYHNPRFEDTQMSIPCRCGIIAPSGTGKTQWILNYIMKCQNTFGHIIVVYKTTEPLYEFLQEKIGSKNITFYTKLNELPQPNDLKMGNKQILLIFDDQVTEKNQEIIKEFYIRGRKIGGGISCMYLSQSFFSIPSMIRKQFNYLIILKLSGKRDLNLILQNYALGIEMDKIMKIYKDATEEKFNFLKIDVENPDENRKFSHNFTSFYTVED